MSKVALLVRLSAKAGKENGLAAFLVDAQPLAVAEPGTIRWFAVRLDAQSFAIFDTFESNAGREAHLNGSIAASLSAHASELLAEPPEIGFADVLAYKLP
jgi:quinol monooxygenase YgiN